MILVCDFFVISREVYEKKSVNCPSVSSTLHDRRVEKESCKPGFRQSQVKSSSMSHYFTLLLEVSLLFVCSTVLWSVISWSGILGQPPGRTNCATRFFVQEVVAANHLNPTAQLISNYFNHLFVKYVKQAA